MLAEKHFLAAKPKSRWLARVRLWHKWGGLVAGLLLLVAATSGIVLNYKRPISAALGVESDAREVRTEGGKSRSPESRDNHAATLTTASGPSNAVISLEQALAVARERWGEVGLERIELRADRGGLLYRIKARSGEELQVNASTGAHFVRGEYEKVRAAADGTVETRTTDWGKIILDLHTGRIGGEAGKAIMSVAALLLFLLTLSGVYLWLKPLLLRRENTRNKATVARANPVNGSAPARDRKLVEV